MRATMSAACGSVISASTKRRLILELFGDRFADARLRVAARTEFLRIWHVDLDALTRQMRRQWSGGPWGSPLMPRHRRLARIHLDRLRDRPRLVGQLLQRQLQLPRVDALGFLPAQ